MCERIAVHEQERRSAAAGDGDDARAWGLDVGALEAVEHCSCLLFWPLLLLQRSPRGVFIITSLVRPKKKAPASRLRSRGYGRERSGRLVANRDAAYARAVDGLDHALDDVAVGRGGDIGRAVEAEPVAVPVAVAMTVTPGGGSGRRQSGGAENSGGTEGENELAEHDGLSCLRDAVVASCPWVAGPAEKVQSP